LEAERFLNEAGWNGTAKLTPGFLFAETAHQDDFDVRAELAHFLERFPSIESGHGQIKQNQVKRHRIFAKDSDRLIPVRRFGHRKPERLKNTPGHRANGELVIDNHD